MIIIVSDVFGLTPALISLSKEIKADLILDPYNASDMGFRDEQEAYAYFVANVGLDTYLSSLKQFIEKQDVELVLVGFSVGASIIWKLSAEVQTKIVSAYCFYGSQIRNLSEIEPTFPLELILPKYEEHFDIDHLVNQLKNKAKLSLSKQPYLHGFMNRYSSNFSQLGYDQQIQKLALIKRMT